MKEVRDLNIKELYILLFGLGRITNNPLNKQYVTFLIYKKSSNIIYRIFPRLLPRFNKWKKGLRYD